MNKKTIRVLTDILMYLAMCILTGTGLLINYRLISGCEGGHGLTLLNLSRHEWGSVHLWTAYILLALIVVHLVLNTAFIWNVVAGGRLWIMSALILSGLLITLFFLIMPIKRTGEDKGHGRFRNQKLEAAQSGESHQHRQDSTIHGLGPVYPPLRGG